MTLSILFIWPLKKLVLTFGNFNISLNSLMVNATCKGPRRPIRVTLFTLLFDKTSKLYSVISVF